MYDIWRKLFNKKAFIWFNKQISEFNYLYKNMFGTWWCTWFSGSCIPAKTWNKIHWWQALIHLIASVNHDDEDTIWWKKWKFDQIAYTVPTHLYTANFFILAGSGAVAADVRAHLVCKNGINKIICILCFFPTKSRNLRFSYVVISYVIY